MNRNNLSQQKNTLGENEKIIKWSDKPFNELVDKTNIDILNIISDKDAGITENGDNLSSFSERQKLLDDAYNLESQNIINSLRKNTLITINEEEILAITNIIINQYNREKKIFKKNINLQNFYHFLGDLKVIKNDVTKKYEIRCGGFRQELDKIDDTYKDKYRIKFSSNYYISDDWHPDRVEDHYSYFCLRFSNDYGSSAIKINTLELVKSFLRDYK
ncbi:MAG: hypothetical protein PHG82_02245 [Candidatus Gracilibacteria bacterium]|nr:hypothetical protein [Candidatus Gracilibacteria bacterium]